jgi:hypothetical protein
MWGGTCTPKRADAASCIAADSPAHCRARPPPPKSRPAKYIGFVAHSHFRAPGAPLPFMRPERTMPQTRLPVASAVVEMTTLRGAAVRRPQHVGIAAVELLYHGGWRWRTCQCSALRTVIASLSERAVLAITATARA